MVIIIIVIILIFKIIFTSCVYINHKYFDWRGRVGDGEAGRNLRHQYFG